MLLSRTLAPLESSSATGGNEGLGGFGDGHCLVECELLANDDEDNLVDKVGDPSGE